MDIGIIDDDQFIPHVIFCNHYIEGMSLPVGHKLASRYIYDYELELITGVQEGYMLENNRLYRPMPGDIIFRRPGETTQGIMCYSSYILCFEHKKSSRIFKDGYDLMRPKSFGYPVLHDLIMDLPDHFHTSHYNQHLYQFKEVLNAFINPSPGSNLYMTALVLQILFQLNQERKSLIDHGHKKAEDFKVILRYIETHLNQDLSLEALASHSLLSPTYFHQLFVKIVGTTPQKYVHTQRLHAAKEMLIHTSQGLKEITDQIGFKDTSYFCHAFKKDTGLSPMAYRTNHQLSL